MAGENIRFGLSKYVPAGGCLVLYIVYVSNLSEQMWLAGWWDHYCPVEVCLLPDPRDRPHRRECPCVVAASVDTSRICPAAFSFA